jgi:exosortase
VNKIQHSRDGCLSRRTVNCCDQFPHNGCTSGTSVFHNTRLAAVAAVLILVVITAWSYWPILARLFAAWQSSDDYSAGQLVPLVAVFFLWRERKSLRQCRFVPCWWGGIIVVLFAEATRIYAVLSLRVFLERYAFVLAVAGLTLLVAGRQIFRRLLWVLLFLFLMFPVPARIHDTISGPLQRLATTGSVFMLEAFGTPVAQQGNIVLLDDNTPMAVAEACSGLRMLTAFIIVAAFIAYMVKRPGWQRALLLVSSIPVAVVCNIVRIFLTAMIMLHVSLTLGEKFFHDFAGLVMMPAAVLLLFGEIWLMDRLVVPETAVRQEPTNIVTRKRNMN